MLLDCINMRGGKHLPKEKKIEMMTEACSFVNLKFAELTNKSIPSSSPAARCSV